MASRNQTFSRPRRNGPNGRWGRNGLNGHLEEYLLRAGARPATAQGPKAIAGELSVPYSTLTAKLRYLARNGRVYHTYVVNPFATRFCHEFRIGLRLDGHQIAKRYGAHGLDAARLDEAAGRHDHGPVERFIDELIYVASSERTIAEHLIMTDAVMPLGAHDHDVELNVVTDDGAYSVRRYVSTLLVAHPCIHTATTVVVGWRYRFNGYSGEYANRKNGSAAGKTATHCPLSCKQTG